VEVDPAPELSAARPDDLVQLRHPEGHEEQTRLVDVPVVAVDDVDLGLVGVVSAAQPVRGHRPAGAAAEDHDLLLRHLASSFVARGRQAIRGPTESGCGQLRG
jgi:hypothetical protein